MITRKFRDSITLEQAASFVDRISNLPVVAIDAELVRDAITVSRDAQLSYWDGLILAAARVAGCDVVLTEGSVARVNDRGCPNRESVRRVRKLRPARVYGKVA